MEKDSQLISVSFNKGAYIFVEGNQNSGCFFIIQKGKVRISVEVTGGRGDENEVLGPGDFIGVVPVMACQSHIETAMALTNVVLVKVFRQQYIGLIQSNAPIAMKIITQFSKRLRYLNEALAQLTLSETAVVGSSHLFKVGEYYFNNKQYAPALYAYAKYAKFCPQGERILIVKERLKKMAGLIKSLKTEYEGSQINRTYQKNAMLFAEGEPGEELFVIQKGSVKIAKIADNNESILAILKAGDIFGEMALLEDKPRMASAVAYEDSNVMAINKANFDQLFFSQPQLAEKITTILADWIWFIYKKLANALIIDPVGRVYDALQIQLEKNRVPLDGSFSQPFHTFDFGWTELLGMAGLSAEQNNPNLMKIKKNSKIQIMENKIHILSVMEIVRQAKYHRGMGRRDKVKRGAGI